MYGSIGSHAIPALLAADFAVTIITHPSKRKHFPPQVKIAVTDFSPQSLALFPDFGFDLKQHSATIYDSGNEPFTAMSIAKIGKPIAAVFLHPEETKDRHVSIAALTTSQRKILAELEKQTNTKWKATTISTDEARREGRIKLQSGDHKGAYVAFLVAQLYQDGAGRSVLDGVDNDLLGVEPESLKDIVKGALTWA
ncbi:hypothetical protein N0V92_000540 [Colletotrichum tropicale]|nr:hypothetical protein N0V92_000540 [Colletotrichum tropicale]